MNIQRSTAHRETIFRTPWLALLIAAIPFASGAQEARDGSADIDRAATAVGSASTAFANALAGRPNEEPNAVGSFDGKVRKQLVAGYRVALRKVREVESCQGLFAELGEDGVRMLSATIYLQAKYDWEHRVCDRGAVAHTFVGAPQTRLCDDFGKLDRNTAAVLLIHEALHHAGLGERPRDPDGPTPFQINRMVSKNCRL
jgi:hypothetical protein